MTDEQGALLEIVRRLEQAWNNGDSVAWTAEFAKDADWGVAVQAGSPNNNIRILEKRIRMKTKKMLKRLNKVEGLLSDVIDGLLTSQDGLERLLGAAKANVAEVVSQLENGEGTKEALPRTGGAHGGLSEEGRKRISEAAKKRWAAAKRKGVSAVTRRRLQQTA